MWGAVKMDRQQLDKLRKRILEAKSREDWQLCIDLCREALSAVSIEQFEIWLSLKADLAYSLFEGQGAVRGDHGEESIEAYEEIISAVDKEKYPLKWARTHMALGYVYAFRAESDRHADRTEEEICEYREKSIFNYKQALSVYTKVGYPLDWAALKAEIGLGYVRRMAGWQNMPRIEIIKKRRQYFLQAIALYQEALDVFTKEEFFEEWEELTARITILREALEYFEKKEKVLELENRRSRR